MWISPLGKTLVILMWKVICITLEKDRVLTNLLTEAMKELEGGLVYCKKKRKRVRDPILLFQAKPIKELWTTVWWKELITKIVSNIYYILMCQKWLKCFLFVILFDFPNNALEISLYSVHILKNWSGNMAD